MEYLDDTLLGRILLLVPREDQLKLFRVSRKWSRVMDENVGIEALLGRGIHSELEGVAFDSIQILSKVGVRSCLFDSFVHDSPNLPKLKRPDLLKYLTIKDFVSSATLESITSGVTKLHTFQINHAALYRLEFSDINFNLPCQSLVIVASDNKIWWDMEFRGLDAAETDAAATNAVYLFRNVFHGLKRVSITFNFIEEMQGILTNALLTLLMNHSTSLTYVHIEFTDTYHNYEQLNLSELTPVEIVRKEYPNLQELHLLIPEFDVQRMEPWASWLVQLCNLESCELYCLFPESSFNLLVTQCQATLQTMKLNYDVGWSYYDILSPWVVNCAVFQNCNNLTNLDITGKGDDNVVTTPLGLLDIESLPKSLITIAIIDINIPSLSCECLCLNFPALQRLTLISVCRSGRIGHGVLLPVIREILRRKQLKQFMLEIGFGNEDDAQEEVIRHAFSGLNRICFYADGFLNKDGKYTVQNNLNE